MSIATTIRALRRSPGETALAILAVALGIGLSVTLFAIVKGFAWSEPNVPKPAELLRIDLNPSDTPSIASNAQTLKSVAGVVVTGANLMAAGSPVRVNAAFVSPEFFGLLGVKPSLGTTFGAGPAERNVVLSYDYWAARFHSDPRIAGKTIHLDGQLALVTGVMPRDFGFPGSEDLWMSWPHDPQHTIAVSGRGSDAFILARRAPGVNLDEVRAEINVIDKRSHPQSSLEVPRSPVSISAFSDRTAKSSVKILMTAVFVCCFLVLLIACSNVALLNLARASRRVTEFAIRAALGASRRRMLFSVLEESVVISAAGAVIGVVFARYAVNAFRTLVARESALTGGAQHWVRYELDGSVLLFVIALMLLATLAAGLFPAWKASSVSTEGLLRQGSPAVTLSKGKLGMVLIQGQIGVSFLLMVLSGLVISAALRFQKPVAWDPAQVASARIAFDAVNYPDAASKSRFVARLEQELRRETDVSAIAFTSAEHVQRAATVPVQAQQNAATRTVDFVSAERHDVSQSYFGLFETRLLAGQFFRPDAADEAVVNETLARKLWGKADAVGRAFVADGHSMRVVAVISDIQTLKPADSNPQPAMYVPISFSSRDEVSILVRSRTSGAAILPLLRKAVASVDPRQALYQVYTAAEIQKLEAIGLEIPAWLLGMAGLSAFVLCSAGTWGAFSLAARQRTREMGIRQAFGAQRHTVVLSMLGSSFRKLAAGLAIGLALSAAGGRIVAANFGVAEYEGLIYASVSVLMLSLGLIATLVPALQVTAVPPLDAIRDL